jgi:anaerobic selenocysteine-containing dehydrogenase
LINYILANNLYHKEYVENYTNATFLINEGFSFDDETGLFSGVQDDPARNAKGYNQSHLAVPERRGRQNPERPDHGGPQLRPADHEEVLCQVLFG